MCNEQAAALCSEPRNVQAHNCFASLCHLQRSALYLSVAHHKPLCCYTLHATLALAWPADLSCGMLCCVYCVPAAVRDCVAHAHHQGRCRGRRVQAVCRAARQRAGRDQQRPGSICLAVTREAWCGVEDFCTSLCCWHSLAEHSLIQHCLCGVCVHHAAVGA